MRDPDARLDGLRKGEGRCVAAAAFDDEPDDWPGSEIEQPRLHQLRVHGRVEPGVVDDVVDVPIDVVVVPARADGPEPGIRLARPQRRPLRQSAAS